MNRDELLALIERAIPFIDTHKAHSAALLDDMRAAVRRDWPNAEEAAEMCERAFQSGGPKVYAITAQGTLRASGISAADTARLAAEGEAVWHRRKVTGERRYAWRKVKGAAA